MSDARKPIPPAHPVGIKDLARALGISTGTVDRALHAKPGVNAMTRARVLSTARSLNYRPNLAARYLKSRQPLRISVHLPREIALFWDTLREGIRQAAAPFAPALHVDFRSYPRLGEGDTTLFEEILQDGTNGVIIAPGNPAALKPYIRKAVQKGIPVVCVVSDAPDTPRLASVSADPFTVGAVAASFSSGSSRPEESRLLPVARRITQRNCAASSRAWRAVAARYASGPSWRRMTMNGKRTAGRWRCFARIRI